jgi:uncharacterized protein with HEPN domain
MSAPRDDAVYVGHILDSIARIESYLEGVNEDQFMTTALLQDAVIRQIQIIGEAANRPSVEFRTRSSSIPWPDVIGMRNKLVHDYMGVDLAAVWDTATADLVDLRMRLQELD